MTQSALQHPRQTRFTCAMVGASVLIAAAMYVGRAQAAELVVGGTGAAIGTLQELGAEYSRLHPGVRVKVLPSLGSGGGVKALLAGTVSIAVTSRPLTDAERANGAREMAIARTPIVIATSPRNPVAGLTPAELASLYSGETAMWKDGTRVRPILRPADDIDTLVLKSVSAEVAQAVEAAGKREGMNVASTDTMSADQLESVPGAFGTTSLSIILTEKRALKPLALDGVQPSVDTLANKKYTLAKTIFLVTTAAPAPEVEDFLRFVKSRAGAKILSKSGNLPLRKQ